MSLEAWGDDGDGMDVPDGWWGSDQVDDVVQAIKDLRAESVYEHGNKESGISVRFLARITMLEHMAGLRPASDPFVREADAMFAADAPPSERQRFKAALREQGPYPGMAEAFEVRYGAPFDHPDWRDEASIWATAWKAARGCASGGRIAPIVPGPATDDGTGRASAYDTTWPDVHGKRNS